VAPRVRRALAGALPAPGGRRTGLSLSWAARPDEARRSARRHLARELAGILREEPVFVFFDDADDAGAEGGADLAELALALARPGASGGASRGGAVAAVGNDPLPRG